jgi:hypothetical protein
VCVVCVCGDSCVLDMMSSVDMHWDTKNKGKTCIHTREYTQYTPAARFDDVDVPVDYSCVHENVCQPIHAIVVVRVGWVIVVL